MEKPFVHLHNHTEYSLLDGAQRIPDMVARAKELGMPALAISDHGAMFGVMEFYLECKRQGVKPIIGMEAYVAPQGRQKKSGREDGQAYHLLLLAKNRTGYLNLCRLATIANLEGYYYKPRIDHEDLKRFSEGIISTTTCLGSEVNQYLLAGSYDHAKNTAAMYRDIFGKENFFVELQDHGLKEQAQIRAALIQIARELDLPLVATNDAHYLCKTDHVAHDVLLCIQTNAKVADENRLRFETDEFYLKSRDEMAALFQDVPEAIENTLLVAEMADVDLGADRAELPDPLIPTQESPDAHLQSLSESGLLAHFPNATDEASQRLEYELSVIRQTGFAKYFLLVREFAEFSRDRGIHFGVRGSAAGSLVSYCIGITDVDPIKYGLTFERFLNPERIQMPDIDMDFEDARRGEVIEYVNERFGSDHVAQIITFGTLGAKASIRDAGRALGVPLSDVDRIAKQVPSMPLGITIKQALRDSSELSRTYESGEEARKLLDTAMGIEGIARHAGVHAAGVVISKEPLADILPLARGSDGQVITQFTMGELEKIGLLKMDFLGLSNLTVLSRAARNIESSGKGRIDVGNLPLEDKRTFDMLARGETAGVFQLESEGMRRAIQQIKPDGIRDIIALVALYRPGPMDHIATYAAGKNGQTSPSYLHPLVQPILEETHGVIVYQDQVLQIVRAIAGFSLGKADILRRAMGKKDKALLDSMKVEFMEGCAQKNVTPQIAEKIWTLLEPFAGYAFNKAHAACYAIIAYQTAYLKANYAVEYMAALLGAYRDKEDRVVGLIDECRRMGIQILPPDINKSSVDFTIEDGKIRFGLGAIKGIGDAGIDAILSARGEKPFAHLFDLTVRAKEKSGLNRLVVEALIKSGALDSIDSNRGKLLSVVDTAVAFADRAARERESGQHALFVADESAKGAAYPILPDVAPPSRQEALSMEKEVLGLYVSDHPLKGHERAVAAAASHPAAKVADLSDGESVVLAGVVAKVREQRTKENNDLMAFITIEDLTGQAIVTLFPRGYAEFKPVVSKDRLLIVHGRTKHREDRRTGERLVEVIAQRLEPLGAPPREQAIGDSHTPGTVSVKIMRATRDELRDVFEMIASNPGSFVLNVEIASINGGGSPKIVKKYEMLRRVSDGPWIGELRRRLTQCFVQVERETA
jgi:DNA polymerase-3 subunit alpha